jgi:NAD(P)-dependent dehydrogenase (short-subunit alcohol dehydrogenase family)
MTDSIDLGQRAALIIGAKGLLPGAIALRLAVAGCDIALTTTTADAEEAFELRRLARSVTEMGRRCVVESVDLSLGTNVQVAVRQIARALGRIDLLAVAPDFRIDRPAERLTDAEWSKVIGLNLSGAFYACRAIMREMRNQEPAEAAGPRGRILVIELEPENNAGAAYRAAKAGLEGLALGLADEWRESGIAVNLLVLPSMDDEAVVARAGVLVTELMASSPDSAREVVLRIES